LVLHVGTRRADGLVDALFGSEPRTGDPEPSTRSCRRATEAGLLLDDQHFQSLRRGGHGGRHARSASTNDQNVAVKGFLFHLVYLLGVARAYSIRLRCQSNLTAQLSSNEAKDRLRS